MTDRYISPFSNTNLPATERGHLSPVQQFAFDIFIRGTMHQEPLTTNQLITAYGGGLATMADSGLANAMRKFLAINDPYKQEPLYANDPFEWGIEGQNGFAGTISNISEATVAGTEGLQVYNVAVMPFPSAPEGVWYDNNGNPAREEYGYTLNELVHLDPLLLVHTNQDFNDALLELQRGVAGDLLEIARPIVRTDVVCHSSTFGRLWAYSGPIGLLQKTPPPFNTLPGGDIYLSDGRGHALGDRSFLSTADPGDTGTNLRRLDLLVKRQIENHLITDTVVEKLVPQGLFGGLLGRTEWRTSVFPSPMARLQSSCALLQDGLLGLGIDPVTAAASAYSWLIGMKYAARNVGINA